MWVSEKLLLLGNRYGMFTYNVATIEKPVELSFRWEWARRVKAESVVFQQYGRPFRRAHISLVAVAELFGN